MCLDSAPGHVELLGDFCVVATLEKQFRDLLLPGTQSDRLFPHAHSPLDLSKLPRQLMPPVRHSPIAGPNDFAFISLVAGSPKIHSIPNAMSVAAFTGLSEKFPQTRDTAPRARLHLDQEGSCVE